MTASDLVVRPPEPWPHPRPQRCHAQNATLQLLLTGRATWATFSSFSYDFSLITWH